MNYYNEFDPFAAAWLRELIKEGLIPYGDVDERSMREDLFYLVGVIEGILGTLKVIQK